MSGRRVHQRFSQTPPAQGQMWIAREVVVDIDHTSGDIVVLSDAPVAVGERLMLTLVGSHGERELHVTVVDTRPQIVGGMVRHSMRLAVVSAAPELSEDCGA